MGWETRKGRGRYYTRSHRLGGRVTRRYYGSGPLAEAVAELDRAECALKEAERSRILRELGDQDRLDAMIRELGEGADKLLKDAGYHRHKGEWRRSRAT